MTRLKAHLCRASSAYVRLVLADLDALHDGGNGSGMGQAHVAREFPQPGRCLARDEFVESFAEPALEEMFHEVTIAAQPATRRCG
jgi:hypothetical protein